MPVYKYSELAVARPSEGVERRLAYSPNIMMTVIDFTGGPKPPAPPHVHPHEQVTYVAQGPFHFIIGEGKEQQVTRVDTGDMVVVPPNVPHTVELLAERGRLVDCFHPIRQDFL